MAYLLLQELSLLCLQHLWWDTVLVLLGGKHQAPKVLAEGGDGVRHEAIESYLKTFDVELQVVKLARFSNEQYNYTYESILFKVVEDHFGNDVVVLSKLFESGRNPLAHHGNVDLGGVYLFVEFRRKLCLLEQLLVGGGEQHHVGLCDSLRWLWKCVVVVVVVVQVEEQAERAPNNHGSSVISSWR